MKGIKFQALSSSAVPVAIVLSSVVAGMLILIALIALATYWRTQRKRERREAERKARLAPKIPNFDGGAQYFAGIKVEKFHKI